MSIQLLLSKIKTAFYIENIYNNSAIINGIIIYESGNFFKAKIIVNNKKEKEIFIKEISYF